MPDAAHHLLSHREPPLASSKPVTGHERLVLSPLLVAALGVQPLQRHAHPGELAADALPVGVSPGLTAMHPLRKQQRLGLRARHPSASSQATPLPSAARNVLPEPFFEISCATTTAGTDNPEAFSLSIALTGILLVMPDTSLSRGGTWRRERSAGKGHPWTVSTRTGGADVLLDRSPPVWC